MKYPLEGLRVVEMSTHVAVPVTARAMADMGADVIKIEALSGDEWRRMGKGYGMPMENWENPLFLIENSNKKLISVNTKDPAGKQIVLDLLAQADVFLSNVRMKSLTAMGLDYDSLREAFPRLIYCHFTGYGSEGPDAARPGFDTAAFWARTGVLRDWVAEDAFPIKPSSAFGDTVTSSMILSSVMTALYAREKTGKGTFVTTSLLGTGIWCNSNAIAATQPCYGYVYPEDPAQPPSPFSHHYRCKDGEWVHIAILSAYQNLPKMAELFGLQELLSDSQFLDTLKMDYYTGVRVLLCALRGVFNAHKGGMEPAFPGI